MNKLRGGEEVDRCSHLSTCSHPILPVLTSACFVSFFFFIIAPLPVIFSHHMSPTRTALQRKKRAVVILITNSVLVPGSSAYIIFASA